MCERLAIEYRAHAHKLEVFPHSSAISSYLDIKPVSHPGKELKPNSTALHKVVETNHWPLQRTLFSNLREVVRNIHCTIQEQELPHINALKTAKMSEKLGQAYYILEKALDQARPLPGQSTSYETWWRKACRSIDGKQFNYIRDTLNAAAGYFYANINQHGASTLTRATRTMLLQLENGRKPPILLKLAALAAPLCAAIGKIPFFPGSKTFTGTGMASQAVGHVAQEGSVSMEL